VLAPLAATPTGQGLYALTRRGDLRTVGDARSFDTGASRDHHAPFVGIAVTPTGDGGALRTIHFGYTV
jgi:hypothetical protein